MLNWTDDIQDTTSTHEDGPVSDVTSLFLLYRLLADMPVGVAANVAYRIEASRSASLSARKGR